MLTPAFWPEVRRGTERAVHELSKGLIERGHAPAIITSHPGLPGRGSEDGVPVVRVPRPPDGRLRRRQMEDYLTHLPLSYGVLRTGGYAVAHAWFTTDALAAARWREATGRPTVHSYMGIPDFKGLRYKRGRLAITLRAMRGCDITVALSEYVAREFKHWLGYDAPVIPPPVDVDVFSLGDERTEDPTIVCAAAAGESRKRVDLLVRAFRRVRTQRPRARLVIDRPRDPDLAAKLHDPGAGVEVADIQDRLPSVYASAWVSALPSVSEAFGLVLAEALACGTPGVGTNEGGIPEVLDRPEIGRLFTGGEEELARALLEAIQLAEYPGTRAACRQRALELSTHRYAEAYESLYRSIAER